LALRLVRSPEEIVVAGGSIAGLATALALGRSGRHVTVLERDPIAEVDGAEAAFAIERRGAPQAHQTHGFLARLIVVLRERFPDVLDALHAAGAKSMTLTASLGDREPDDDDLDTLIVRRTTFEWALRDAVRREPGVTYLSDVAVEGLVRDEGAVGVPHVAGARLSDGTVLPGSVIACTGRRGAVPAWLAEVGVTTTEDVADTHIVYLTRWYRRPTDLNIDIDPRLGGDFGYLKYLAIPCDGSTFSVTLAVRSMDTELRGLLLDPEAFDRACRILPGPDRFFASADVEPLGPVRPMGGLINRLRRFTDTEGLPLVTGFHAVGDSHTCTNPMYGRGCSLAFVQATLLADAFADHPDDPLQRALVYESSSTREVEPWFHSAVLMDSFGDADGVPKQPDAVTLKFGALIADVMLGRPADPIVARGLLRMINTLVRPDELMADREFVRRVASYFAGPEVDPADLDATRVSRGDLLVAAAT
jgi:2-polyprenyl-6-methoxyphenol hydroxylase-like FAD-dependent oxidoreductase